MKKPAKEEKYLSELSTSAIVIVWYSAKDFYGNL